MFPVKKSQTFQKNRNFSKQCAKVAKIASRRQYARKMAKIGPKQAQDDPRQAQDGLKLAQDRPKTAQSAPKQAMLSVQKH